MSYRILPYGRMEDRRIHDRGRRIEDCSPLLGLLVMAISGFAFGAVVGYMVRAWWV